MKTWRFAVDRGGTFTDVIGIAPDGSLHTEKLLSRSPLYEDASIEGVRRILCLPAETPLSDKLISGIRFGTTVATNALLQHTGGRVLLLITEGMRDLLEIAYQSRPDIFALSIKRPAPLYGNVIEVRERIGPGGSIEMPLNTEELRLCLSSLKVDDYDAVAVVLMHAWQNPVHEIQVRDILNECLFPRPHLSHETSRHIKAVTRGQSTVLNAFLSVVVEDYLNRLARETGRIETAFMQSSGRLAAPTELMPKELVLSGPAGGVVAVADIFHRIVRTAEPQLSGVIGFDMGGTSTDVCRYEPDAQNPEREHAFERTFEREVGGVMMQSEMLDIVTVAAGGGSCLRAEAARMLVGPGSAGADPGPACYGFGGPAAVTDANLVAGRIIPEYFPRVFGPARNAPLDGQSSRSVIAALCDEIAAQGGRRPVSVEAAALGYIRIANEKMAAAIREISVSRGFDVRQYALVCFGGAGGQHAAAIADILGIRRIVIHPLSGLLCALGIGMARSAHSASESLLCRLQPDAMELLRERFERLEHELPLSLDLQWSLRRELEMRPLGTERTVIVSFNNYERMITDFEHEYESRFGIHPGDAVVEVSGIRVEAVQVGEVREAADTSFRAAQSCMAHQESTALNIAEVQMHEMSFMEPEGMRTLHVPVYRSALLPKGALLHGPAIIADEYMTTVVDPGWQARLRADGVIMMEAITETDTQVTLTQVQASQLSTPDPVLLEVFNNSFRSIAIEMGRMLENTAHSVNIRERLDFSCALFDARGGLVANAPHIPVHLGSMGDAVRGVIKDIFETTDSAMRPGDMYLTNDPYHGGSHLPDMTVVAPVVDPLSGEVLFYTAARGHHADMGGITPGSMPPGARHIEEEGVLVACMKIVEGGRFLQQRVIEALSSARYPARNMPERLSDLRAQIAACARGQRDLQSLVRRYGSGLVLRYMSFIQDNAAANVQHALMRYLLQGSGDKTFFTGRFEDALDDGTPLAVRIDITAGDAPPASIRARIDFEGTGPQHEADNLNAPEAVTRSAVLYVLRALTGTDMPLNEGCLRPVEVIIPGGSLLSPRYPAPVASGNVETSQRVVDVLLGAFAAAAASQGTMNNLLFEIEGETPYYETIGGGSGALVSAAGASGVQVHMTNTRMTDPEVLEFRHPGLRVERFALRRGSGGEGLYRGGEGIVRQLRFLKDAQVSIISERRGRAPWGIAGGEAGKPGRNILVGAGGNERELAHRVTLSVRAGEAIRIETPGGGGAGIR